MNTTTTRAELKSRAKEVLKQHYWYIFGVCILASLITGIISGICSAIVQAAPENTVVTSVAGLINILAVIFVAIPVGVGLQRFFINVSKGGNPQVNDLFYVYKNNMGNAIGVLISEDLYSCGRFCSLFRVS